MPTRMLSEAGAPGRGVTRRRSPSRSISAPRAFRQAIVASMSFEDVVQRIVVGPGQRAAQMSSLWAIDLLAMASIWPPSLCGVMITSIDEVS